MPTTGAPLLSPFGLGTPTSASEPPEKPPSLSRYLNPGSGSVEVNSSNRQLKDMPGIRQRVLIAVRTLKGSSTVLPQMGITLPEKMDGLFERRVADSVRVALLQLTDTEKVIRLDSVLVKRSPVGRARITVAYTVIETDSPDQIDTTV